MTYRKKLIEVALPLEAINAASAKEKEPFTRNHPRSLHIWWARRPLAACRAVLFASLVDDPSSHSDQFPTEKGQAKERARLFKIIENLVTWENSNNEEVLKAARAEIFKSTGSHPPPVYDPFCGGGSIPIEGQRLGLKSYGTDLNPVAVLITKALIEIPPKFAGLPPVNPNSRRSAAMRTWKGAEGLAEDVLYYGKWIRDEAEKRIGHLYPKVRLPKEHGGKEAPVIAWIWARTVKCPNPACGAQMPLVRSFALSTKKGKEAWVEPIIDRHRKSPPTIRFEVLTGQGHAPEGTVTRRGSSCIACGSPVPFEHVRAEGKAGRMGTQLMAIVAEGQRRRVYLSPEPQHETIAARANPKNVPETGLPTEALGFRIQNYGMTKHKDLFTRRQLVALTVFGDLLKEACDRVKADGAATNLVKDDLPLEQGGAGCRAYAESVLTYLGLAVSRWTDLSNTICSWNTTNQNIRALFSRQAIPMSWDFAELSPFSSVAPLDSASESAAGALLGVATTTAGTSSQLDAVTSTRYLPSAIISTDPPYYDNIDYADLSDFFYIWLRRSLANTWPDLFSTLLVPKTQELVATPFRFDGDRGRAQKFFEDGIKRAFEAMHEIQDRNTPMTVYYAFKQTESEDGADDEPTSTVSTGWETMLEALLQAGFFLTGTWPMRTERSNRTRDIGSNALASSIVLVCRQRPHDAPMATRKEFVGALKKELRPALHTLQQANIAPVDLAQASIGPGMAVYSRYAKVLEPDGSPMSVRTALALINQEMDSYLAEQEGEMDADSRFCLAWFEQYGMKDGPFGVAETLSKAKNTSVEGIVRSGCLSSKAGRVRLLSREEMPADYDPVTDDRRTVWECVQHLIKQLASGGVDAAGRLTARMGPDYSEQAKALAYRLFVICERKKWPEEALAYNGLITSWGDVQEKAQTKGTGQYRQATLDESES